MRTPQAPAGQQRPPFGRAGWQTPRGASSPRGQRPQPALRDGADHKGRESFGPKDNEILGEWTTRGSSHNGGAGMDDESHGPRLMDDESLGGRMMRALAN